MPGKSVSRAVVPKRLIAEAALPQPELSTQLRTNKLKELEASQPQAIATSNIGCLTHLQAGTATPVTHWIELLEQRVAAIG